MGKSLVIFRGLGKQQQQQQQKPHKLSSSRQHKFIISHFPCVRSLACFNWVLCSEIHNTEINVERLCHYLEVLHWQDHA